VHGLKGTKQPYVESAAAAVATKTKTTAAAVDRTGNNRRKALDNKLCHAAPLAARAVSPVGAN